MPLQAEVADLRRVSDVLQGIEKEPNEEAFVARYNKLVRDLQIESRIRSNSLEVLTNFDYGFAGIDDVVKNLTIKPPISWDMAREQLLEIRKDMEIRIELLNAKITQQLQSPVHDKQELSKVQDVEPKEASTINFAEHAYVVQGRDPVRGAQESKQKTFNITPENKALFSTQFPSPPPLPYVEVSDKHDPIKGLAPNSILSSPEKRQLREIIKDAKDYPDQLDEIKARLNTLKNSPTIANNVDIQERIKSVTELINNRLAQQITIEQFRNGLDQVRQRQPQQLMLPASIAKPMTQPGKTDQTSKKKTLSSFQPRQSNQQVKKPESPPLSTGRRDLKDLGKAMNFGQIKKDLLKAPNPLRRSNSGELDIPAKQPLRRSNSDDLPAAHVPSSTTPSPSSSFSSSLANVKFGDEGTVDKKAKAPAKPIPPFKYTSSLADVDFGDWNDSPSPRKTLSSTSKEITEQTGISKDRVDP